MGSDEDYRLAKEAFVSYLTGTTTWELLLLALPMPAVVAILAVDFRAFPRRLAKAEATGVGLMDLGSSAFVFASGLLPPRSTPLASKGTVGLAALAGARLVTIKLLGYPEHVSEYGVHWNFFATLLCVRVAVSLWRREGILGLPGYCMVFLLAERLMNAPFVLLACAHSTLLCGTLSLVEACASGPLASRLSDVLSRNMLGTFLVANLLTGAVNLSTDTLAWGDGAAAVLLVCYLGAVVAVAVAMDRLQWRIKV
ncbi:hypothetical protein JKP88DRAFT_301252 [Tribonema minus]|uniref:GPI-anchored wall transfer protein 1 n=1 Tax=Tribonema minus TaxID=303371 RepID=A0A835ZAY0_9STRA|nr:hypothetical protein JKP88DRAFT_301252 [Tribonema minus]